MSQDGSQPMCSSNPYVRRALRSLQVLDALYAAVHPMAAKHYHAFFSSELGGIVTEPALMFVHIDDHMVHRCEAGSYRSTVYCA